MKGKGVLGIDTGLHGAIALLWGPSSTKPADTPLPRLWSMPLSGGALDAALLVSFLREATTAADVMAVYVEKTQATPKIHHQAAHSMGMSLGMVYGALAGAGLGYVLVTPQAWKRKVLAGTKRDKPAAIAYCRRRWPELSLIPVGCRKPHDGWADALCIAVYAAMEATWWSTEAPERQGRRTGPQGKERE